MSLDTPEWILKESVNWTSFSYSKPHEAQVTHMCFTLNMNNSDHSMYASNVLTIVRKSPSIKYVSLDVYELEIVSVRLCEDKAVHVPYYLTQHDAQNGQGLVIQLPDADTCKLVIKYIVSERTPGLQWQPRGDLFLIHSSFYYSFARSVIPCQDSPKVRCPYAGEIITPAHYQVLMAGICSERRKMNADYMAYRFEQNLPVCSHHIGFAIGQFEYRDVSSITRVWYESGIALESDLLDHLDKIPRALKMLQKIQGPFVWGIYDVLIMREPIIRNYPCLMWLSENVTLSNVFNMLARNWLGCMVSCRSWQDFWLHEAYGKFIERKLLEMFTTDPIEEIWQQGLEHLSELLKDWSENLCFESEINAILSTSRNSETVDTVFCPDMDITDPTNTRLVLDLANFNPNISIPKTRPILAEKGAILFYTIENMVGVVEFEQFLKYVVDKYKYETITTDMFVNDLKRLHFSNMKILGFDWDAWLILSGNVREAPEFVIPDKESIQMMATLISLNEGDLPFTKTDLKQLSLKQLKYLFKHLLEKDLSCETMEGLNDLLDLDKYKDIELKQIWLKLCVKNRFYKEAKDQRKRVSVT